MGDSDDDTHHDLADDINTGNTNAAVDLFPDFEDAAMTSPPPDSRALSATPLSKSNDDDDLECDADGEPAIGEQSEDDKSPESNPPCSQPAPAAPTPISPLVPETSAPPAYLCSESQLDDVAVDLADSLFPEPHSDTTPDALVELFDDLERSADLGFVPAPASVASPHPNPSAAPSVVDSPSSDDGEAWFKALCLSIILPVCNPGN